MQNSPSLINQINFDSKKFVEEEFNKSKYLTISKKPPAKRVSMLSSEIRNKFKRKTILRNGKMSTSNFFGGFEQDDLEDDDFNITLNKIIRKNIDYWVSFFIKFLLIKFLELVHKKKKRD